MVVVFNKTSHVLLPLYLLFVSLTSEMFGLTSHLAKSHLTEASNIFYRQILKNWDFFYITAVEKPGDYSSDGSKAGSIYRYSVNMN